MRPAYGTQRGPMTDEEIGFLARLYGPSKPRTEEETMSTAMATRNGDGAAVLEQVVIGGDLSQLTAIQRVDYYNSVCKSVGLNPLTKPFEYIVLNDKLTLYARRDATDQLRAIHKVNITIMSREIVDQVYVVLARASMPDGRTDDSVGAVALVKEGGSWERSNSGKNFFKRNGEFIPLSPDDRANAMMKAETKAKRRVTLSICGLGWLDETEVSTIPDARPIHVDMETGEVLEALPAPVAPGRLAAEARWRDMKSEGLSLGLSVPSFDEQATDWETLKAAGVKLGSEIIKAKIENAAIAAEDAVKAAHKTADPTPEPTPINQGQGDATASPAQVKAIFAIGRNTAQLDEANIKAESVRLYGQPPAQLTKRQASDFIDYLKQAAPPEPAPPLDDDDLPF